MESAFRTVLSAAGVLAACYVLTAASWIQVLLLFLAASLGWCIYVYRKGNERTVQPRRAVRASREIEIEHDKPLAPPPPMQAPAQPRHIVHRFPIHKLAST